MSRNLCLPLLLASLVGCAIQRPAPVDVQIMPNDCANRAAIVRWLENQAAIPPTSYQTDAEYAQQQSKIRYRLWTLRYNCQPV
jgi:hypothetical protein